MSLIQEALRRQAEEKAENNPTNGAAPPAPSKPDATLPRAPQVPPDARHAKPLSPLWIFVPVLLLVLVGGVFLIYTRSRPQAPRESEPSDASEALDAAPVGDPAPPATAHRADDRPAPPPAESPEPSLPPAMAQTPDRHDAPSAAPTPTPALPPPPEHEDDLKPSMAEAAEPPPPSPAPQVDWPVLSVSGVLSASFGRSGAAIVNRQVVGIGESVMGARLVSVFPQKVEFEFQGERRVLRMGQIVESP